MKTIPELKAQGLLKPFKLSKADMSDDSEVWERDRAEIENQQRQLQAAIVHLIDERDRLRQVVDLAIRWKEARDTLSAEHPRTFPTNRRLTQAQFELDAALARIREALGDG